MNLEAKINAHIILTCLDCPLQKNGNFNECPLNNFQNAYSTSDRTQKSFTKIATKYNITIPTNLVDGEMNQVLCPENKGIVSGKLAVYTSDE